jgi:hypothetical protein
MFAGGEARLPYRHGKSLPGRRHPVEAASRRSRAREQREPLPNDAGPAPWRQAGGTRVTIVALRERDPVFKGVAARWSCCKMRPICRTIAGSRASSYETGAQSVAVIASFTMCTPPSNAVFRMTDIVALPQVSRSAYRADAKQLRPVCSLFGPTTAALHPVPLRLSEVGQDFGLLSLTPSPFWSASRNSMPALTSAFWTASTVLIRESTIPFSSLATAFSDTIALSASCCWDQPSNALAARICRAVIMLTTFDTPSKSATIRVEITLLRVFIT